MKVCVWVERGGWVRLVGRGRRLGQIGGKTEYVGGRLGGGGKRLGQNGVRREKIGTEWWEEGGG